MSSPLAARSTLLLLGALGVALASAAPAAAQLSTPTFANNSNPNELFLGSASVPSYERETSVGLVSMSSASGAFATRFAALVTADGDGTSGAGRSEALFVDYTIQFTATAAGAYRLTVDTALSGELHLVNDGTNGATAQIGDVSGFSVGGTVIGGNLDLPTAGIVSGSSGSSSPIAETKTATIFGVSNGAPVAHSLTFQWSNSATTPSIPGDEAAVRLGGTSDVPSETAGDYPGAPARVQADDGHFVTVTLGSLCGNGVVDSGPSYTEQCDDGPSTGQPGSCCAANCTFASNGTGCDDGNACTTGETCTTGVCGGGAAQTCPLCETCNPGGGCEVGPRASCKVPTVPLKASLQLKKGTVEAADGLTWKWIKGAETEKGEFGSPTTSDDYALCLFKPTGDLAFKADIPAGGTCGGTKPCWKVLDVKGFSYKDADRTPNGIDRLVLKAGLDGKAKVTLKGKGLDLPAIPIPLQLPATVQVQAASGACWQATYTADGASRNDGVQFKGKGS